MLTVHYITFGPFAENTYFVYNENNECIIIDPGCYTKEEKNELSSFIQDNHLIVKSIFLTHTHIDHVFGLQYVKLKYQVPIIAHPIAASVIKTTEMVAQVYGFEVDTPPTIDVFLDEGEEIELGNNNLKLLFCPGHSPDHLVLFSAKDKFAIVGDVIFNGSIGRTDLPGGNFETLISSIKNKLFLLPLDTILYPGHGIKTNIKQEITSNPFLI